ncbi:MAG: RNA polymerase sigma factor [Candidatus Staskawiczbacteria bacterium]|jgi:RNA polymerase sigma-70 factor (ECF subfamily)
MNDSYLDKKDEEIVLLVQSGQVEPFNILINRYEKKMARYAGRLLSNRDDIQDVVQDIFTKTYVNIKSFDVNRKFSSWLYRIAHNEIVNVFKKNKKNFLPIFDVDIFFPQHAKKNYEEINKDLERKEMQKMISVYFEKLGEKYKEPIALYYLEDLSYKEISEVMQIPVVTVGVRIKRAKEMLKNIFKEQGYEYGK